jgi:hypothetical protein
VVDVVGVVAVVEVVVEVVGVVASVVVVVIGLVLVVAASNVAIEPAQFAEVLAVVPLSTVPADDTMFSRYAALIT